MNSLPVCPVRACQPVRLPHGLFHGCRLRQFILVSLIVASGCVARAQAPLVLYGDHLVNGFQDWSWGTHNLANSTPVHSGTSSASLSGTAWNVALSLNHSGFNTAPYTNFSFWAYGGATAGQVLQVYAHVNGADQAATVLSALPPGTWKQFSIPLTSLGADSKTNFERITIQLTSYGTANGFYLDDIQFGGKPAPELVHLSVNAAQPVRVVDSRWFALNTAIWDSNFDTAQTISLLKELGTSTLRFPGGSLSDEYHWATDTSGTNTWRWVTSFANFVHVATNVGAQAFITVNYGSGTPAEAAAWVRSSNITNHYGFKYWEIGNELYGTWETDTNAKPNDAYTYAVRAKDYIQQMKTADPTIKIGVVVTPGEDSSVNGYTNHPATNAITGQVHYGWTPVLLSTLKGQRITPDFAINHRYPEYTSANQVNCSESDALVLQDSTGWAVDAADLRRQIAAYFGPLGTNIELMCTENNSDAGAQGRQSTSLVNGLYFADSLGHVMQTEFNAFVWWDLRNGSDTSGSFDSTLYGWRSNGDLGMVGGLNTRYPPFYAAKMMQYFARPGDAILTALSDYQVLTAFAARRVNGALSLLVLNKDTATNFNAQVALNGFIPNSAALLRSFGIPQDEAARTNGPAQSQDIATNNFNGVAATFNYTFPALSLTLFTLPPAPPTLTVVSSPGLPENQVILQLQGQPAVPYIIQCSTDLNVWASISTNLLTTTTLSLTNPVPTTASLQFWRALWQP
jgi:hypothetical protein